MRGRKPIPSILKLVSGSHNIRKDVEREPDPKGDLCDPPEELSAREKIIWRRTIARAPAGLLRELDSDILQLYVETWVEREEARAKANKYVTVDDPSPKDLLVQSAFQSPYLAIIKRATDTLKGLMSDLGFNPTSRGRISISGSGAGKANRFSNNAAANKRA